MSGTHAVRAIDHIGMTVPDIDEASTFLSAALGAEVLYDLVGPNAPSDTKELKLDLQACLGIRVGTKLEAMRMMRLGEGPCIELFQYSADEQRSAALASDLGMQHLAVYVDDIDAVQEAILQAGGSTLAGPNPLPGIEGGDGNRWVYTLAPWGTIIELITYPSPQGYEKLTNLRRWRPSRADDAAASSAKSGVVES
jgi:catechol 2,3-dioxygenase-like lactoylglutathione lyase family enzyme